MSNFQSDYLELLRRQVEEEISFLISHGHKEFDNHTKCNFCFDIGRGNSRCNRLSDLRRFLSELVVWQAGGRRQNAISNSESRRKIGYESSPDKKDSISPTLPQLLQPF